jgi:hypothetical protein
MHVALHWWNRLKWLADLNALLMTTPENGVERFMHAAEARGPAVPQSWLFYFAAGFWAFLYPHLLSQR